MSGRRQSFRHYHVLPQPVLIPADYNLGTYYKNQFDAALYEQIRYFVDNPNLGIVLGMVSPVKDNSGKYNNHL